MGFVKDRSDLDMIQFFYDWFYSWFAIHVVINYNKRKTDMDRLVQERHNSIANALELRLFLH